MNRFYKLVFMAIYVLGSYYTFKGIMHNILRYQQYNSIFTQKEADQGEKILFNQIEIISCWP